MFTTLIVRPVFNLLVFIYALLPGHNFGAALIIFTIIVRLLMWPLLRKGLHHTKAMRKMQPELKRIKANAKGDKQKEALMQMELYKEKGINPLSSMLIMFVQIPIVLGLYSGVRRLVNDHNAIINFSYPFIRNMSWVKQLGQDIHRFDGTLFKLIDLTKPALAKGGGIYIPALFIVVASAYVQYRQSKQLLPSTKDARGLRAILKEAGDGQEADKTEVNAAVGRSTMYMIPILILVVTLGMAAALPLYWLVGGIMAIVQQSRILGQDEDEMEALADKKTKKVVLEGEVVEIGSTKPATPSTTNKNTKSSRSKKRRKR